MDKIPVSAAINTSVEIAKSSQLSKFSRVVNGFLRSVNRFILKGKRLPLPEKLSERFAQQYSLPYWLSEELITCFGEDLAEEISQASNKVPSFDLRVNCLRSTPKALQKVFEEVGIKSDLIEDFPYGLKIEKSLGDLRQWPGYHEGWWCVQDRSSQWISPLLDPQPGEKILDACAAPGSKTTHLAELIGNEGEVWAVDRSVDRLKLVSENASRLGAKCVNILATDSLNLLSTKPEWRKYFHRILVDAPCSGLGTLARNPDARWRINSEKLYELVRLQAGLLEAILPLLSSGGRIVYSTCTIHPDENRCQIEKFLTAHPDLKLVDQKQILPNVKEAGDGFYSAILELI